MSFAEWLSDKIEKYHMSQAELSQRLGVTRGAVNNLLSGRSKNPSADTIQKLADIFRISVDDIYRAANLLPSIPEADQWTLETQRKIARLKTPRYKKIVLSLIETLSQQEQEELQNKK